MMAELRGLKDMTHTKIIIEKFELEPSGCLKRMSLGMKRKLAIVTAFMHDPEIIVLDEPTSGLDPIMQNIFIEFIKEEKKRGKTILLSSHIFSEIDATCDKISIIKDGPSYQLLWQTSCAIMKVKPLKLNSIQRRF